MFDRITKSVLDLNFNLSIQANFNQKLTLVFLAISQKIVITYFSFKVILSKKSLNFETINFLKMCPIFVGSLQTSAQYSIGAQFKIFRRKNNIPTGALLLNKK